MSGTERKKIDVVSFDEEKVEIRHEEDGSLVVVKKTDTVEIINMSQVRDHLISEGRGSLIWRNLTFAVSVPEVISWDSGSGVLVAQYFAGENLELLLRSENEETRRKYVDFTKTFVSWMRETGTIWVDAAPRNIAVNEETKEIGIFDFEKGSLLQDKSYTPQQFNTIIRGIVCEEFSAFLFPEEQQQIFGDIWTDDDILVSQNYLRGKRERILYGKLFGNLEDQIPLKNAISVQKLMAEITTPYLVEGEIFFPLVYLAESKSAEEYIGLLLEMVSLDKSAWRDFLSQRKK